MEESITIIQYFGFCAFNKYISLIISNDEVGFLFKDDEFYVNQAYDLMKLDTLELIGRSINNVGGAYDNFKYVVALIFKGIGPRLLSVYIVNFFAVLFAMIPKYKKELRLFTSLMN